MALFYLDLENTSQKRFDLSKFLNYTDTFDPLTSEFLDRLRKLTVRGVYTVEKKEGDMAFVSNDIYGDTQFWWILLQYNNKIDFRDVSIGDILNYPSLGDLEDLLFELGAKAS